MSGNPKRNLELYCFIMMASSLGYPTLRPVQNGTNRIQLPSGTYGVPDVMTNGLGSVKGDSRPSHPLEYSEKKWFENQQLLDFTMLRNTQGIHAPLKLQMERHAASKVQRLPCLASSNIMLDTLMGKDEMIGFEDIFNDPFEAEVVGDPHILMERKLNIL